MEFPGSFKKVGSVAYKNTQLAKWYISGIYCQSGDEKHHRSHLLREPIETTIEQMTRHVRPARHEYFLSADLRAEDLGTKLSYQHIEKGRVVWDTLQGINISHLGKRKIIFKMPFLGDMLVSWRVPFDKLT